MKSTNRVISNKSNFGGISSYLIYRILGSGAGVIRKYLKGKKSSLCQCSFSGVCRNDVDTQDSQVGDSREVTVCIGYIQAKMKL